MSETAPQFDVVSSNTNDRRVFFSGIESDCREFVEQHYPRPHVEPGSNAKVVPDVYVQSPDGVLAGYDGKSWSDDSDEPVAPDVDNSDDSEENDRFSQNGGNN